MDADPQPERLYAGEFRHSVDEKNRITIPSRWRRGHAEEFILLPEATHQFLIVMSPTEFAKTSSAAETNLGGRPLPKARIKRGGCSRGRAGPF